MPNARRSRLRIALIAAGVGLALIVGGFLYARFGTDNFHVIEENRWYRAAQMDAETLESTLREHKIKTVLALRGHNQDDDEWYAPEAAAAERAGAKHVVAKLPSSRLPWRSELRTLFEALDGLAEPVLVHCKAGSDRTGLVSAIWLHDYAGRSLDVGREQLDFLPYMHFRYGSASPMHEFLDLYEAGREAGGHNLNIRNWVKQHYFNEKPGRELRPWYDRVLYRPEGGK